MSLTPKRRALLVEINYGHVYSRPWHNRVAHMCDDGTSIPRRVTADVEWLEREGYCQRVPGYRLSRLERGDVVPPYCATPRGLKALEDAEAADLQARADAAFDEWLADGGVPD